LIGLDGANLDLVERFQAEGRMPGISQIFADGSFGPLRSVFPYNSAAAWTSLVTGVNPGRHGIYDFVLPAEGQYRLRVATRRDRRMPALWNHASDSGARVAVVNIPMTFPAEPVNGVMVSGMDAPRLDERAVHPAGHLEELRRTAPAYRIMSNAARMASRGDFGGAARQLIDTMEARAAYVRDLVAGRDFDLVVVNLEATDGAHHFFWQHHDPEHPRHDGSTSSLWRDVIGQAYEASDRHLRSILESYAPDTVFVVSDHGGGPSTDWVLFLNDWLIEEGFLVTSPAAVPSAARRLYGVIRDRLPVPVRRSLRPLFGRAIERARGTALFGDIEWSQSRAYAQMQPSLRINAAGREPEGVVPPDHVEDVLAELTERALSARLPGGSPLFGRALHAEEVYRGGAPGGPDLVLELPPGTHIRSRNTTGRPGFVHRLADLGIYLPSGVHTPMGMVAAAGAGIARAGRVQEGSVHQVAPSLLAAMGISAPGMDSDPFSFVESPRTWSSRTAPEAIASGGELEEDEEAEVLERLRGLGYVD
jgi:predicted AlkP superfamily phosphohydrolase/phosphomutase